jgi:kynurenine 3-monooxygenase
MMQKKSVTVVGAGLVGALWSVFLAKKGYKVTLFDKRRDIRLDTVAAGKSINLALSDRGWKALDAVGLKSAIASITIPMYARAIHQGEDEKLLPYGKDQQAIHSVSRLVLNQTLLEEADKLGVVMHFEHVLQKADYKNRKALFSYQNKVIEWDFELLFGADGAYAATRLEYQTQQYPFEYQQHYIDCCYKELLIPAVNNDFVLQPNALHIWPGQSFMLIALPNQDKSFTCTLFMPPKGENSFEHLNSQQAVEHFFRKHFASAVPLMPTLWQDFQRNPTSHLVTVKCYPWTYHDSFSLIGDAAHAIVPFFGQGMNCGFEDCAVLNDLMEEFSEDWSRILPAFQERRKQNTDAIADLAVENFHEMSAKVADPDFVLQKQIEGYLYKSFPEKWIPSYSLVTFSPDVSYAEARKRGQQQNTLMQQVIKEGKLPEDLTDKHFLKSIIDRLG